MISRRDWLKRALQVTAVASVPPLLLAQQGAPDPLLVPDQETLLAEHRRAQAAGKIPTPRRVAVSDPDTRAKERDVLAAFPLVPASAINLRPSNERGHANHGWLDTHHSFSFANYYDPQHMGFRALRVINEDWIAGSRGFPMHPHKDMEIVTYILDGALEHKDSLHNGSIIRPGKVQRMTAGSGIRHSEFNPQQTTPVHLLQIWMLPDKRNHRPGYAQRKIKPHTHKQPVRLIASREPSHRKEGAVTINQDVFLYACKLAPKQSMIHLIRPRRHTWIQVARGQVKCNGKKLSAGDGASLSQSGRLQVEAQQTAELLIFDLA